MPRVTLLGARVAAGDRRAIQKIRSVLERHGYGVKAAAAELGIGAATLHRWMAIAGIEGRGTPGPVSRKKST